MHKAITIWLILPEEISMLCTDLNHSIEKNSAIRFSPAWPYPRISLVQCILTVDEIQDLVISLSALDHSPIHIDAPVLYRFLSASSGSKVTYMNIESTPDLISLHCTCMDLLSHTSGRQAEAKHFVLPDHISDGQIAYVTQYASHHAYQNFSAHITIARWHLSSDATLPAFDITQIGIYHMWPNGTCQTLLHTI